MKTSFISLFLCLAILGISCGSASKPGESLGRAVLEEKVARQSQGNIKVVSFRKTNAEHRENIYNMEFEVVIEFLADGAWTKGGGMDSLGNYLFSPRRISSNPSSFDGFTALISDARNVNRGQRETVTGSILFTKTENGWRKFE